MGLDSSLETLLTTRPEVTWSVSIRDLSSEAHWSYQPNLTCSVASVGKLLLLAAAQSQIEAGLLSEQEVLDRTSTIQVADSGLWQHLDTDSLPVHDAMVLIASVSDNLATNALIDRVSIDDVAASLPNRDFHVHDYVRDIRTAEHPPTLATGTAAAIESFWTDIATRTLISPSVSEHLQELLRLNTDLSLVASAISLDPLAHHDDLAAVRLSNKTGSDKGVLADCGLIHDNRNQSMTYCVIANWDSNRNDLHHLVVSDMQRIGEFLHSIIDSY